jgi:hypothetical protein
VAPRRQEQCQEDSEIVPKGWERNNRFILVVGISPSTVPSKGEKFWLSGTERHPVPKNVRYSVGKLQPWRKTEFGVFRTRSETVWIAERSPDLSVTHKKNTKYNKRERGICVRVFVNMS